MAITLRPYQNTACELTIQSLIDRSGNGLIIMPTGTGKSIVIADLIRRINEYPHQRVIVATHSQELVEQDYEEFMALCPFYNAGIYCAGLKSKNHTAPVLFVSIQSVYEKAFKLGQCDVLMVDEAQGISRKEGARWQTFIKDLKVTNPYMRILGLTATGYRLDSGNLIGGEDAMFHFVCYEYPILEAIEDGYLCTLVPKSMATKYNVSNVHSRGGDFIPGELEKAVNVDEITQASVAELVQYGANRKSWIVFGAGVDHCESIAAEIRKHGVTAQAITIKTTDKDRKKFIRQHKSGEITALISMIILTVGYNNKRVDLIADMCPTKSKGRHVQKLGRGTRVIYAEGFDLSTKEGRIAAIAASEKPDCLVLDYARNVSRHGPIDQIKGDGTRVKGDGEAPIKVCPAKGCHAVIFAGTMECPDCGYIFPEKPLDVEALADDSPILSTQIVPIWHEVLTTRYSRHTKNMRDSMKVTYITTGGKFYDFICLEHTGYAREMAAKWHRARRDTPVPNTVGEALETSYPVPARILTKKDGKYDRVLKVEFLEGVMSEPEKEYVPPVVESALAEMDDFVPF